MKCMTLISPSTVPFSVFYLSLYIFINNLTVHRAMSTSEKFCLRLNNFQENINTVFESLRNDTDFTDVTLACEDGRQLETHKIILAVSSPFFQNMLRRNKHTHLSIYMRGLKYEDLAAILDFLYYGEANIYQDNLDTFLNIAEELDLKGLKGKNKLEDTYVSYPSQEACIPKPSSLLPRNQKILTSQSILNSNLKEQNISGKEESAFLSNTAQEPFVPELFLEATASQTNMVSQMSLVQELRFEDMEIVEMVTPQPKLVFLGDLQNLDKQVDSLMTPSNTIISDGRNKKYKGTNMQHMRKRGEKIPYEGTH